jgi:transcriptional regulator with XRE-family HTH domain
MTNTEPFGARVKSARLKQDFSFGKLAEIAGMSRSYLHELENGKSREPSVYIALRLAAALGVTVEHLAFGVETEERDSQKELEAARLRRLLAQIEKLAKQGS